jgi:cell fate regulator YaaT (PSP1 superfamily)
MLMGLHLVQYGALGHVGRFSTAEAVRFPRQSRVVVRSPRGLEAGRVLAEPQGEAPAWTPVGQILRRMTVEDELLDDRLRRRRDEAFAACQRLLDEERVPAALVDVEHLLDGQGLYFYFLGDVPPAATAITERLAAVYETAVEFRRFAETLAEGCGPGCGTDEAKGQGGCSTCSGCAVSAACSPSAARR